VATALICTVVTMDTLTRKRGFTLIELLVVISIIGILAGLSSVIISSVLKGARISSTESTIQKIEAALENYYHDNHCFPPTPEVSGSKSIYSALTGDENLDGKYNPSEGDISANHPRWRGPYLQKQSRKFINLTTGDFIDPWNNALRYFENEREARQCSVNPKSFLLYSSGPDMKATEATREDAIDYKLPNNRDNIRNWKVE